MIKQSLLFVLAGVLFFSCMKKVELPGPAGNGTRLPNHWILTPAGTKHIPIGDLPLNMALSPDGSILAITNNGYSRQFISLIDTKTDSVVQELNMEKSFYATDFQPPTGKLFYASGGSDEKVRIWKNDGDGFEPEEGFSLKDSGSNDNQTKIFVTGIAVSENGKTLYVSESTTGKLAVVSRQKQAK